MPRWRPSLSATVLGILLCPATAFLPACARGADARGEAPVEAKSADRWEVNAHIVAVRTAGTPLSGRAAACAALGRLAADGLLADPDTRAAVTRALTGALGDRDLYPYAAVALHQVGADATPILAAALAHEDPATRDRAAALLIDMGERSAAALPELNRQLRRGDDGTRRLAAEVLDALGPAARPAAAALSDALHDKDEFVRSRAESALARINADPAAAPPPRSVVEWRRLRGLSGVPDHTAHTLARKGPAAERRPHLAQAPLYPSTKLIEQLRGGAGAANRAAAADVLAEAFEYVNAGREDVVAALRAGLKDPDLSVRVAAAAGLWRVSPKHALYVMPVLREAMRDERLSPDRRYQAALALAKVGPAVGWAVDARVVAAPVLLRAMADSRASADTRRRAADALADWARANERVRSVLLAEVTRQGVRQGAGGRAQRGYGELLAALARAGGPAADDLAALVTNRDAGPATRLGVLTVLAEEQGPARSNVPAALAAALREVADDANEDGAIRAAAAVALANVDPAAAGVEPMLLELTRPDSAWRTQAAFALARRGQNSQPVIEALVHAVRTGDDATRARAARLLGEIGGPDTATWLRRAITDVAAAVRAEVVPALARLDPAGDETTRLFVAALGDDAPRVRARAAEALAARGPAAAIPALAERLNNADPAGRDEALKVLAGFGADAGAAVPNLIAVVKDRKDPLRVPAVYLLGRFVETSKQAASVLQQIAADEMDPLRVDATYALRGLDQDAKVAARRLIDRAAGGDRDALFDLARLGPAGFEVVPSLARMLQSDQAAVRRGAAAALRSLGRDAAPAIPALTAALSSDDNVLRVQAAAALGAFGPDAAGAVPALLRMSDNPSQAVRRAAADALVRIDPGGARLAPALLAAVYNADAEMRDALAPAVRKSPKATAKVAPLLAGLARNDPDVRVRTAAERALSEIGEE